MHSATIKLKRGTVPLWLHGLFKGELYFTLLPLLCAPHSAIYVFPYKLQTKFNTRTKQIIRILHQICKILQLIGTIFKKMRKETTLKIYNTLVSPTFLYGSEIWTLTALQRRRIDAAEMKLLRPLAGYTLYDHKTEDYIRRKLRFTGILDKRDEYRRNWLQHLQRMPQNRIPLKSYHYRPQGRRTIGRPKKRWREKF